MHDEPTSADRPAWSRGEVVWPLAIFAGFAGTWTGLAAGAAWLAPLGALGLYAPIHVELGRRGASQLAAATGLGWVLGIGAAILGSAFEGASGAAPAILGDLPLVPLFARDLGACGPESAGCGGLAWGAALVGVPLTLAALGSRATRGALGLVLAALGTGAVAGALAGPLSAALAHGAQPLLAVLAGWPPHHAAWILAVLCWSADGGAERPGEGPRLVRSCAWALAAAALGGRLVLGGAWSAWATEALGAG